MNFLKYNVRILKCQAINVRILIFLINMVENQIGKAIKINRITQGLTQKELARRVGVTHAAISYWENGVNVPNVKDCWAMADAMDISIDELVGRYDK